MSGFLRAPHWIIAVAALLAGAAGSQALSHGIESPGDRAGASAAVSETKEAARTGASTPASLPMKIGGPFSLVDHMGRPVSDRDFRGRYMLIFFGYANCPGICPTGLRAMTEALDLLGEDGEGVVPILITVDPKHDTAGTLAPAVARIHPRLIGLTGTLEALSSAARAYRVSARPVGFTVKGKPLIEHGSYIYLMGPDGAFITLFPPILDPESIARALRAYLG